MRVSRALAFREHLVALLVKPDATADDRYAQDDAEIMTSDDEPRLRRTKDLTVPGDLERLSVDEMVDLRDRLRAAIDRLNEEIEKRADVRRAAEAMFKRPLDPPGQ